MTHIELTDTEIIKKVLAGEQAVFAQLVQRYQSYVFTLVLRFTDNREDAEEISQDVFVKAYRSLADFRGDAKFSTWLYTIVRTSCITFLRKKRLETTSLDNERTSIQVESRESGFTANAIEQKSKHAMVNAAIQMLSPDDTQILTLFYKGEQIPGRDRPGNAAGPQYDKSEIAPGKESPERKDGKTF